MELGKKKSVSRNVVRGSVWESRMKMDEVKGGIKVFNGEEDNNRIKENESKESQVTQSSVVREKRRTWKQEPVEVAGRRKIRLEPNKMNTRSVSIQDDASDRADEDEDGDDEEDEEDEEEEEEVVEKKSIDVKEIVVLEQKPEKIVKEEKKVIPVVYNKSIPCSPNVRKQSPLVKNHTVVIEKAHSTPLSEEPEKPPKPQSKLQNIADLLMWRDVSRTVFVFGLGSFILISCSYADDLDISLVSVISYTGLVYLAAIFIYKSLICSGDTNAESSLHLVGEEEAIWFLRLILPPLNEIILELKAIFSGDPATTMKLAVLLFLLARWGSFITIGKMVKLGFFGAFTLPKVCSSYSVQLTSYSQFLIQHIRDAWNSCAYKKVITFGVFILLWNFSSTLTRIWAVFMLAVIARYYQQSSPGKEQSKTEIDTNPAEQGGRRLRQGVWENGVNPVKEKKVS